MCHEKRLLLIEITTTVSAVPIFEKLDGTSALARGGFRRTIVT